MIAKHSRTPLVLLALLTSCGGNTGSSTAASPTSPEATAATPEPGTPEPGTPGPGSAGAHAAAAANTPPAHSTAQPGASPAPAAHVPPAAPKCSGQASFVPGGTYQRAGTKNPTTVSDLCVDTLETTVTAYNDCVTAGKCTTTGLDCSAQATWGKTGKEQQPVVCIDYDQANAYCAYQGKRLPTLEEWEWVARSGEEGRTYTWGNEPPSDQLCWTGKQRQTESCVVGTHPADKTATGALDMAGNVLEFVTTTRDAHSPVRIAKGGAWNGGDAALFTNGRLGGFRKEYRCGFLGVRCVAPTATADAP